MTDQTPRTEAGRALLALYLFSDPWRDRILAIEAQARAEGLDVEVLARALHQVYCAYSDHPSQSAEQAHRVEAETLRAILAGKTEEPPYDDTDLDQGHAG